MVWDGVEMYKKWDEIDFKSTRVRGKTHKETLQNLSNIAKTIVTDFMPQTSDIIMQNPLNWPVRVIAANSLYRVTKTILLGMVDGENQGGDALFESISITITTKICQFTDGITDGKFSLRIIDGITNGKFSLRYTDGISVGNLIPFLINAFSSVIPSVKNLPTSSLPTENLP